MTLPNRKLQRLKEYDYSTPGAYFITICTFEKKCIFGKIIPEGTYGNARMVYSPIGEITKDCIQKIEKHFPDCKIDNWVIMPNHIHILLSTNAPTERIYPFPTTNISSIIGTFKAAVTRNVGNRYKHSGKIWQTSFYDHIVRNDQDYLEIWQYISGNPSKWLEDQFFSK